MTTSASDAPAATAGQAPPTAEKVADTPNAPATETPPTKEKFEELRSAAVLQYSLKNFEKAADLYGDASEVQAQLNGEMAPENAELLFYYARACFKVALAKSDVLGNKVTDEEKKKPKKAPKAKKEVVAEGSGTAANGGARQETVASKPYFSLEGDGDWSDFDEEGDEDGEEAEEEEDDLLNAYETFELARVLYQKQLDALEADSSESTAESIAKLRAVKEKIADCHGYLCEISMENERFDDAIGDARQSLTLQEELNFFEHENVSEAHYMLSLALEMASNRKVREGLKEGATAEASEEQETETETEVDYELRKEAAKHTDLAIKSLQARLEKERSALAHPDLMPEQKKEKDAIIKDKSEVLDDLKIRLTELQSDPKSQAFDSLDSSVFSGLIAPLLGADPAAQKAKLAEVTKSANDISGLVKKKKASAPAPAPATASASNGASTFSDAASAGKRKLDVVTEEESNGKRAKTEDIA